MHILQNVRELLKRNAQAFDRGFHFRKELRRNPKPGTGLGNLGREVVGTLGHGCETCRGRGADQGERFEALFELVGQAHGFLEPFLEGPGSRL